MSIDTFESSVRRIGGVAAFALVAMALLGVGRAWRRPKGRIVGRPFEQLPFALFAGIGVAYTAAVVCLWRPLPVRLPRPARLVATVLGSLLYGSGLGLTFWGRLVLGEMYNVSSTMGAELYQDHRLVTSGPFALIRHPMYLGALIGSIGGVLLYGTWTMVFIALHVPIFFMRAHREEEALAQEFGEEWRAYCRRVPAGIPVGCGRCGPVA